MKWDYQNQCVSKNKDTVLFTTTERKLLEHTLQHSGGGKWLVIRLSPLFSVIYFFDQNILMQGTFLLENKRKYNSVC